MRSRRNPIRAGQAVAYYLPYPLIPLIQKRANKDYGGNASAPATEALCEFLGVSYEEVKALGSTKAALGL